MVHHPWLSPSLGLHPFLKITPFFNASLFFSLYYAWTSFIGWFFLYYLGVIEGDGTKGHGFCLWPRPCGRRWCTKIIPTGSLALEALKCGWNCRCLGGSWWGWLNLDCWPMPNTKTRKSWGRPVLAQDVAEAGSPSQFSGRVQKWVSIQIQTRVLLSQEVLGHLLSQKDSFSVEIQLRVMGVKSMTVSKIISLLNI